MWLNIQKWSEHGVVYSILTLEMCFVPQRRALFQHLNFQKCSGVEVYCAFWLRNVLPATTACNYSTSQLPKVLWRWGVLCLLTSKCASRHNGVQLFNISTSKSAPALRCIVPFDFEMCFAPQRRAIIQHLNFQKCSGVEVYCAFWLRNVLRASVQLFNISTSKSAPALRCIVPFDFEMCFAPQRRAIIQHLNFQKCSGVEVYCAFWLRNVLCATTACNYSTSQLPKVLRCWGVLCLLTSKCASRHNGMQLFNISTSKSAPALRCIVPFDFDMCFAPQRRAIIQHLNFQKCSGVEVYCAFWLRNVLRATTACNYSTSQLPKVLRRWGVLCLLTSKCASRHNGMQLFNISTSKSAPALRCIVPFDFEMCFAPQRRAIIQHLNFQKCSGVEVYCAFWLRNVLRATRACNCLSLISSDGSAPAALASLLFDPGEPQNIGKNTASRDSSTFSCTCIFFLLTLSLLWSTFFCLSSLLWLFPPLLFICPFCQFCLKFDL